MSGNGSTLDTKLAGLRMMLLGLIGGQLVLAAVLIFSTTRMNGPLVPGREVGYLFLALGLLTAAANAVAVPLVVRSMRAATPSEREPDALVRAYIGETVVRAALLEAPGVILLLGFVLTADWLVLAPVPVLLAWLVTLLPSRPKFDAWLAAVRRPV